MQNIKKTLLILFVAAAVSLCFYPPPASGFFSSVFGDNKVFGTGNINVVIENLISDRNLIESNSSQRFSFALENDGTSPADYLLEINISWNDGTNALGNLFLFPADLSDAKILESLNSGDYSKALNQTVDNGVLEVTQSKDYSFKLFFFENEEVLFNEQAYNEKYIAIEVAVNYYLKDTNWFGSNQDYLLLLSSVPSVVRPVITEKSGMAKTFFITQTAGINLSAYASVFDQTDGDITSKIKTTSSPAFDQNKSGEYEITYSATNSGGINAIPLKITIVIWDFARIEGGNYHALALTSHGRVYAWGNNYYGQLGDGTNKEKTTPRLVETLSGIIDIAAGNDCSYALDSKGQIFAWGLNENGRLGDNTTENRHTPVPVLQPEGLCFKEIAANFDSAAAITANGEVYAWGYGGFGALGDGLKADKYIPTQITGLSNIEKVAISRNNGAAITSGGKLYTWGYGSYGRLGNGSSASTISLPAIVEYFDSRNIGVKDIGVGQNAMAAISDSGELFTWGYGAEGQIGNGGTASQNTPQLISLPSPALILDVSDSHTGVLTNQGFYLFGDNYYGQLGLNYAQNSLSPVLLNGVSNITNISLAANSTFVLSDSQTLYGVGYGGSGLLGNGANGNFTVPSAWTFTPPLPY